MSSNPALSWFLLLLLVGAAMGQENPSQMPADLPTDPQSQGENMFDGMMSSQTQQTDLSVPESSDPLIQPSGMPINQEDGPLFESTNFFEIPNQDLQTDPPEEITVDAPPADPPLANPTNIEG